MWGNKKKILIRGGGGKNDKIQTTEQNRQQKRRKNKTHTDLNAAPVEPCAIVWLTEPEQTGVPLLLQTDGGLPQLSTLTSSEWQILMGKKMMPVVTMKKPLYTVRRECNIHRNCLTTLFWTCGKGFTEQIFCFYAILIDICLWDSWFFCPDSELLMLAPCLGHSDFIIQAPSSNKASLQPVTSSSFFFSQARVDMVYFINHRNGQAISAGKKKKKPYEKTWLCFLNSKFQNII